MSGSTPNIKPSPNTETPKKTALPRPTAASSRPPRRPTTAMSTTLITCVPASATASGNARENNRRSSTFSSIKVRLAIERHSANRTATAAGIDSRLEQLTQVRHLDEHVAVTHAVHGDREEEHRHHREEHDRCRRRGGQRRDGRGYEEILHHDQEEQRQWKEDQGGKESARLHPKVGPQCQKAQRHKISKHQNRGEVHLADAGHRYSPFCERQHPHLQQDHPGE